MPAKRATSVLLAGILCLTAAIPGAVRAQEEGAPDLLGDGPLDLDAFPAKVIDGVVVPVPSEIFWALEKLGVSDWTSVLEKRKGFTDQSRRRIALALGVAVADGLLAVQAQNASAVEEAGREVLGLAGRLGLRQTVAEHCQSIFEGTKERDWNAVRLELDRTQQTVRDTMGRMRDEALADLVSLGGWVRGTEAMTELISNSFTSDKAEVLQQPALVGYFRKSLAKYPPEGTDAALLGLISSGLETMAKAMAEGDSGITSAGTLDMHEASERIVNEILKNGKETAAVGESKNEG